jgi:uncharacterized metal-binding protein YceD (DUF177 family)
VEALKEHTIPFTGLKDGEHDFQFELGDKFIANTGDEDMEGGSVTANVKLVKSPTLLVTTMVLKGVLRVTCDRCGGLMDQAIEGQQRQIFQLDSEEDIDDDELVGLPPGAHSINLTHYFYECMRLALPARRVHAPGHCDPAVEELLGQLSVEHEPVPDPRWEALNNLKNQQS